MNFKFIKIETYNEEEQEYLIEVDGVRHDLSYTNHDLHGWDGMEVARDIIDTFVKLFDIPVIVEYREEE